MKTIVHVNQHKIKSNKKHEINEPVLAIKSFSGTIRGKPKENLYAHEAKIVDEDGKEVARVVYNPEKPLSCGATVWIETELKVEVIER